MVGNNDVFAPALRRLGRLAALDEADYEAIRALPFRAMRVVANQFLLRAAEPSEECCFLVSGYAVRHKVTQQGGRQIVSFHLPGDIVDLQYLLLGHADQNIQTISPAKIIWVPKSELRRLTRERPAICEALWRETLIDAARSREWIVSIGRRDARARVAHMLCEFAKRAHDAGICRAERFELPMTQEHLADATGLTAVYVNRMLQSLSAEGIIKRDKRHVEVTDWAHMHRVADFDPAYLHAT